MKVAWFMFPPSILFLLGWGSLTFLLPLSALVLEVDIFVQKLSLGKIFDLSEHKPIEARKWCLEAMYRFNWIRKQLKIIKLEWKNLSENLDLDLDLDFGIFYLDIKNRFELCFSDLGIKNNDFLTRFGVEMEEYEGLE